MIVPHRESGNVSDDRGKFRNLPVAQVVLPLDRGVGSVGILGITYGKVQMWFL